MSVETGMQRREGFEYWERRERTGRRARRHDQTWWQHPVLEEFDVGIEDCATFSRM